MKDLKQYVVESLLDDEDDLATNYEEIIWKFLHDNYNWTFNRDSYINIRYDKKDGYIVDSIMNVSFKGGKLKNLTNGLFRWGKVKDFYCGHNKSLTSLEGAPQECKNFSCAGCENLTSLEGAPKKCIWFSCSHCPELETLEGAPEECERFYCNDCEKLKTLEGAPKKCEEFYCTKCNSLTSLEGAPKKCDWFDCRNCPKLNPDKFSNILNKYDKVLKDTWSGI